MKIDMREFIYRLWARVAGRPCARSLNHFLLSLGARGLGVGNAVDLSGEGNLLGKMADVWKKIEHPPVFFDVGANEGDYSRMLRQLVPNSQIYAFEPHPKTLSRLKRRMDESIRVIGCGVGATSGVATLWDYSDTQGSSHASLERMVFEKLHSAFYEGMDIRVVTLDGFCEENDIRFIDFLKIDVEGKEADCLRGASVLLRECRIGVVQFEFNSMHALTGTLFHDLVELLPRFRIYRILPKGCIMLDRKNIFRCHFYEIQNIVAVSPKMIPVFEEILGA